MTESRRQMTEETRPGTTTFFCFFSAFCALHLIPYTLYLLPRLFWQRSAASYQFPVTSHQRPISSNAFTLLEVMVAMAIMAIVLVSVYRMHSQTLTMNTASRFYTQAPMLGQSTVGDRLVGIS